MVWLALLFGCENMVVAGWIVARPDTLAQATQPRPGDPASPRRPSLA